MTNQMVQLQEATIKAQGKRRRMPILAAQFSRVAEQVEAVAQTSVFVIP